MNVVFANILETTTDSDPTSTIIFFVMFGLLAVVVLSFFIYNLIKNNNKAASENKLSGLRTESQGNSAVTHDEEDDENDEVSESYSIVFYNQSSKPLRYFVRDGLKDDGSSDENSGFLQPGEIDSVEMMYRQSEVIVCDPTGRKVTYLNQVNLYNRLSKTMDEDIFITLTDRPESKLLDVEIETTVSIPAREPGDERD